MIEREVSPKPTREETVLEFCARHGIAENTYYYQARKKENQEKIIELSLIVAKSSVPEILKVLVDKAKGGDMKAIDTYLDSVAKLAKHIDLSSMGKPISILSNVLSNPSNEENPEDEQTD